MPLTETLLRVAPYLAEFLGTFTVVFVAGCCTLAEVDPAWVFTARACIVTVLVYSLEAVSGAHFNPAVTLGVAVSGKAQWKTVCLYWAVQIGGGVLAGVCCGKMFHHPTWTKSVLFEPVSWWYSAFAEFAYTCMLSFVMLNVTCTEETAGNQFYGLAIGFVVAAGGYATGGISLAAFNPAVYLGIDIAVWDASLLRSGYGCLWECLGASAGALLYRVVRPEEYDKDKGSVLAKCVSELVGTFYFALTVLLALVTQSRATALAATACLMCMTYALAGVSGANFNPAVSLGIVLSGRNKLSCVDGLTYCALQLCAGTFAGVAVGAYGQAGDLPPDVLHVSLDGPSHGAKYSLQSAFVAEFLFSAVYVFVMLAVATAQDAKYYFGLAIGAGITAGAIAMGSSFGGALNPAVALSISAAQVLYNPAYVDTSKTASWVIVELLGGAFAAIIFRALYWREYEENIIVLEQEEQGGAEVGSMVAGNSDGKVERAVKAVHWFDGENPFSIGGLKGNRSCRVCS